MSAKPAQHYIDLARRNMDTAQLLATAAASSQRDVTDWLTTLHFYTLCIIVKALGRCRGRDFQDHYAIRQWLNTEADLLTIAGTYRKVEEWSRDARYEGRQFDAKSEIPRLHGWFESVRDHLARLLESHGLKVPRLAPVEP